MPIDQGAIFDLATNSVPITTLQACPAPAHALVGTGGPDLLSTVFAPLGAFYRGLFLASVVSGTDIFGPEQHDVVVWRPSQEGGSPAAATTLFGFPDGIHIGIPHVTAGNTGSTAYSNRVRDLLDTRTSETDWAFFRARPHFKYFPLGRHKNKRSTGNRAGSSRSEGGSRTRGDVRLDDHLAHARNRRHAWIDDQRRRDGRPWGYGRPDRRRRKESGG